MKVLLLTPEESSLIVRCLRRSFYEYSDDDALNLAVKVEDWPEEKDVQVIAAITNWVDNCESCHPVSE